MFVAPSSQLDSLHGIERDIELTTSGLGRQKQR